MPPKSNPYNLTDKQKLFCELYVSKDFFGNGFQSYVEAYNVNLEVKGSSLTARSAASRLLTKDNILKYLQDLLDDAGLNDIFVDKQLLFLITQKADFKANVAAIKEYNVLRQRIETKVKQTKVIELEDFDINLLDKEEQEEFKRLLRKGVKIE